MRLVVSVIACAWCWSGCRAKHDDMASSGSWSCLSVLLLLSLVICLLRVKLL